MFLRSNQLILLFLMIVCMISSVTAGERMRVAVLDFSNLASLEQSEVVYLGEMVRSATIRILPRDSYIILTRENIYELLPEGVDLIDCLGDCAVETGRNIGVDFVITGEVISFGGELRLNIKLHETVEGGQMTDVQIGAPDILGLEAAMKAYSLKPFEIFPGVRVDEQGNSDAHAQSLFADLEANTQPAGPFICEKALLLGFHAGFTDNGEKVTDNEDVEFLTSLIGLDLEMRFSSRYTLRLMASYGQNRNYTFKEKPDVPLGSENLYFREIGLSLGYVFPTRVPGNIWGYHVGYLRGAYDIGPNYAAHTYLAGIWAGRSGWTWGVEMGISSSALKNENVTFRITGMKQVW